MEYDQEWSSDEYQYYQLVIQNHQNSSITWKWWTKAKNQNSKFQKT